MEEADFGCFVGDRHSPENICHFAYDHFGRAVLANKKIGVSSENIYFPYVIQDYSNWLINKRFPDAQRIELGVLYKFDELMIFEESCFGYIQHPGWYCSDIVMDALEEISDEIYSGEPYLKLYVSRMSAITKHKRRFVNEGTLQYELSKAGFVILHPDHQSPEQQISLFRRSRTVVGPHGAALTNLFACRDNIKVIELKYPYLENIPFMMISKKKSCDYSRIEGRPIDCSEGFLSEIPIYDVIKKI